MDIRGCETCQAKSLDELDWNTSTILNDTYKTGWLSPEGKFFGCNAYNHRKQAQIVHKKSETDLEEEGWIRINYMFKEDGEKCLIAGFSSTNETIYPTREQLRYLSTHYPNNKDLYYEMWNIARIKKSKIQDEWGV